ARTRSGIDSFAGSGAGGHSSGGTSSCCVFLLLTKGAGQCVVSLLIVIQSSLVLSLPQIEIAQLIVRGSNSLSIIRSCVKTQRRLQSSQRLVCLASLEESPSFLQGGACLV